MFVHYRTRGFILKKEDRGEADRLFTIFTKDFGKLEILGKAIRKITSKLRAGAELFYLSEIEFIQGKAYKTLTDTILINKFENLRNNVRKLNIVQKISEIFDNLVRGQESDEKIWNLLSETFQKLNTPNLQFKIYKLHFYCFFWNLVSVLGFRPELYNCSLCQKRLSPEKLYFEPKRGGVICSRCQKSKSAKEITPDTVKILRILLQKDWSTLKKLKIKELHFKILKSISSAYYTHVLGEMK